MRFDHPEFHTKKNECWFEFADEWTVRAVLDYDSILDSDLEAGMYVRFWNALKAVISPDDRHCDDVSLDLSLDDIQDKKTLKIIKWAGLVGWSTRITMDVDEKN